MQRTRSTTIIETRTQGRTQLAGRVTSRQKDFAAERAAAAQRPPRVLTNEGRAPMTDEGGHPAIDAALALLAEGGR